MIRRAGGRPRHFGPPQVVLVRDETKVAGPLPPARSRLCAHGHHLGLVVLRRARCVHDRPWTNLLPFLPWWPRLLSSAATRWASSSVVDHERRRRHRDLTTRAAPDCHPDGVVGLIGEDRALVAVATGILDLADQASTRAVSKKARCAVRAPCFDEQLSAACRCRVGVALGDDDDVGLWSAAGRRRSAAFRRGGDAGGRQRGGGSRAGTGDGCGALWCSPTSSARAEQ